MLAACPRASPAAPSPAPWSGVGSCSSPTPLGNTSCCGTYRDLTPDTSVWRSQLGDTSLGLRGLGHPKSLQEEGCRVARGSGAVGAGGCQLSTHCPVCPCEQGGPGSPGLALQCQDQALIRQHSARLGQTIPSRSSHFTLLTFTATVTTLSRPVPFSTHDSPSFKACVLLSYFFPLLFISRTPLSFSLA